jgi:MGT family glycosyltransferase
VTREAGGRFLAAATEAVGSMDGVAAVVVGPADASAGPGTVLVRSYVPQLALMPRLAAVVCHGGNNTVCEALSHGVPLVVAPVRDDQPVIAEQVVRSGAGLRVRFGRAGPDAVRTAVHTVLRDPSFRAAARRCQPLFAAAGGAAAAADRVEKLAS